jgi:hypothetical protein
VGHTQSQYYSNRFPSWFWGRYTILAFFLPGKMQENKYGKPPPPKIDFKGLFGF